MGRTAGVAVALALLSLVLVLCSMPWLWFGLGGGIAAITAGWTTYQHRSLPGAARLFGAAASSVGLLAVALATVRIALSIAATVRLERMLG
jgi:hypothetical protein